ncbi:MAG: serine O-acetyltransferase [Francisellaceae bacterium]|jgi:serine O-acetyltransferase
MNWKEFKLIVRADLFRYGRGYGGKPFFIAYFKDIGYRYTFWWRFAEFASSKFYLRLSIYPVVKFAHRRMSHKYGISIPIGTEIGAGFYIGHFGNIVVSGDAKIGKNCNISQGVTIGQANRGRFKGVPTIGDRVYMAAGSKIVGKIIVGDDCLIAANTLVSRSVDEYSVCLGVPADIVSNEGSRGYVDFIS